VKKKTTSEVKKHLVWVGKDAKNPISSKTRKRGKENQDVTCVGEAMSSQKKQKREKRTFGA